MFLGGVPIRNSPHYSRRRPVTLGRQATQNYRKISRWASAPVPRSVPLETQSPPMTGEDADGYLWSITRVC
jgi:hypothetical protein